MQHAKIARALCHARRAVQIVFLGVAFFSWPHVDVHRARAVSAEVAPDSAPNESAPNESAPNESAPNESAPNDSAPANGTAPRRDSAAEMACRIDAWLAETWRQSNITAAADASDTEFLRRASLDLIGILPTVAEVRAVLAETASSTQPRDVRAAVVNRLIENPRFASHVASAWRDALTPPNGDATQFCATSMLQSWLRERLADNLGYDKLVTELLTATGAYGTSGAVSYFTAFELKPEELASNTSRVFLGVQIQCAQCHNHPFDHWTRQDFWGYAAFFARLPSVTPEQPFASAVNDLLAGEVKLPGSEVVVPPRFLGVGGAPGELAPESPAITRRAQLAAWLASSQNPYFAQAAVNRVWGHLFGRGLVDPVDDMGAHHPTRHAQVLQELSRWFAEGGFDLRELFRAIALTQAYQLTSQGPGEDQAPELFSRMGIKALTADQLYDCLGEAVRRRPAPNTSPYAVNAFGGFDANRQSFVARFQAARASAREFQAGIPQALTMMNGRMMVESTDIQQGDLLRALEAPFLSDPERVEILYLSTLSRLPRAEEAEQFVGYVQDHAAMGQRQQALGDVLWALLNSGEFMLNH